MNDDQTNNLQNTLEAIPPDVRESLAIKGFIVRTVATDDERSVSCYPFCGTYIEVCLKSDKVIKELDLRNGIEQTIGKKLSCYCSPEMLGCEKTVYRVDFEMQGVD